MIDYRGHTQHNLLLALHIYAQKKIHFFNDVLTTHLVDKEGCKNLDEADDTT